MRQLEGETYLMHVRYRRMCSNNRINLVKSIKTFLTCYIE